LRPWCCVSILPTFRRRFALIVSVTAVAATLLLVPKTKHYLWFRIGRVDVARVLLPSACCWCRICPFIATERTGSALPELAPRVRSQIMRRA